MQDDEMITGPQAGASEYEPEYGGQPGPAPGPGPRPGPSPGAQASGSVCGAPCPQGDGTCAVGLGHLSLHLCDANNDHRWASELPA